MAQRQFAFASAWYFNQDGQHTTATRGQVVDLTSEEEARLDKLGALVPVDGELDRPGVLQAVTGDSSDEHVVTYLASGKTSEILVQAQGYPSALVERLAIIERANQDRGDLVSGLESLYKNVEPETDVPLPTPQGEETGTPDTGTSGVEAELEGTVDEIEAAAQGWDLEKLNQAVAAEQAGKNRKSLVEKLEKLQAEKTA